MATPTVVDGQPDVPPGILKHEEAKGAAVYTFNPDDSPAQKAAAPASKADGLSPSNGHSQEPKAVTVEGGGSQNGVVPTITVTHDGQNPPKVVADDTKQVAEKVQAESAPQVPGDINVTASAIPDWYIVGWRQAADILRPSVSEGEEKDKFVLDKFVSEQFYGSWYHNAGVVVFAVFCAHFFTRLGFGWGWLFVLLAICNTYYTTSMARFRRNARDDIQRELVKTKLGSEHETADWLNHFLERFWLIYEPVLSSTIVSSVDQVLSANTPAFLDSLRLTHFTLGTKAPRIDKVRTFTKTADDIVMMDWAISFTPTDESDMTQVQARDKVNPKIILSVRLGKGLATAALPVLVEDITFSGLMRFRMKLVSNFPHIQIVDFCFLEKPVIDYVLKPIGGETFGVDIANIPGLSSLIRDTTHSILGPMMYEPNMFTLNLEQLLSGQPLDSALGVLQVTIHSARGIKGVKIGGGTPDPYVSLSINERTELARTKCKHDTYNPVWMETKYILVNNLHERLVLDLFDYNDHRSDQKLGSVSFDLSELEEDTVHEGIVGHLLKDGKDRGELRYDVAFHPTMDPDPQSGEVPDSSIGIVRLVVHQAKQLDSSKSLSSGGFNPFTRVYINGGKKPVYTTQKLKHTNNPVWEASYEFLCTSKDKDIIEFKVIDDRDFLKDPVVGHMSIRLSDLLEAKVEGGRDWFPLSGCKSGKIRVSAQWKPVNIAGSLQGVGQYTPPIGVVKLHIDKAVDVKNVEAALGGKSDPYVRVQVKNVTKGRTEVIDNNLNPVWDQIVYIPVHSLKETFLLECMDYQHLTKDRSLGSVELHLADLAKQSDDPRYPYQSTGVKTSADPLRLDKGNSTKGTLFYSATFIPSAKVKGISFDQPEQAPLPVDGRSGEEDEFDPTSPVQVTIKPKKPAKVDTNVANEGTGSEAGTPLSGRSTDYSLIEKQDAASSPPDSRPASSASSGRDAESDGVEMTTEQLLSSQSGIIIFHVISAELEKKGRVEVLLDDGYWPCFSTEKARSHHMQYDHVGEGFMKELDWGQVWIRLNEAEEGDKDDVVAEWKGPAKDFLQDTLTAPQEYVLLKEGDPSSTKVKIEARYLPVPVVLEPRESVNNQGVLHVELLDGHDIRAADRTGKSDPFVVFTLNGQKVFKSQTKKKTLSPEWKESFDVTVPSRVGADFSLEVFDWNQIEQAKSLGEGKIDLVNIEAFEGSEQRILLTSAKHGEKGCIRIMLVFSPMIIAKQRKNTSTFSSAGRAMTQIGGLPVSAGKGVFHGVTGVFKRDKANGDGLLMADLAQLPTGQASQPVGVPAETLSAGLAAFPSTENVSALTNEPGTLRVTVIDGKDLPHSDIKSYVLLRVGEKEHKTKHSPKTASPEWNESFRYGVTPQVPKVYVSLFEHKTLGKDKELANGEIDIWRHIQPRGASSAEVMVELRQGGLLRFRLEFDSATNPSSGRASVSSGSGNEHGTGRTMSIITSPSRFSLRGKRPTSEEE